MLIMNYFLNKFIQTFRLRRAINFAPYEETPYFDVSTNIALSQTREIIKKLILKILTKSIIYWFEQFLTKLIQT